MDGFKLYNSKTRTKELFIPLDEGKATMYVCGITPYDVGHLGHALVYSVQDTLHRWLDFSGYEVTHIQNITDIDDDMIRKSETISKIEDLDSIEILNLIEQTKRKMKKHAENFQFEEAALLRDQIIKLNEKIKK